MTGTISALWILTVSILTLVDNVKHVDTLEISRMKDPVACRKIADEGNKAFKKDGFLYRCVPAGPFAGVSSQ